MDQSFEESETTTIAGAILESLTPEEGSATVIGLSGDLGAGKTTITKSLGAELGVTETITSPTFVIAKFYHTSDERFKTLIHIDAYRIEEPNELTVLGWDAMLAQKDTLIVVEWPERVESLLPQTTVRYEIDHHDHTRRIRSII